MKLTETRTDMQWEAERDRQLWTDLQQQRDRKNKHRSILPPTSKSLLFQMSGQLDIRPACASVSGSSALLVWFAVLKPWLSGVFCNQSMHCSLLWFISEMGLQLRGKDIAGKTTTFWIDCMSDRKTDGLAPGEIYSGRETAAVFPWLWFITPGSVCLTQTDQSSLCSHHSTSLRGRSK